MRFAPFLTALACSTCGCASNLPVPDRRVDAPVPEQSWAVVLSRHVDERGGIDFDALAADPRDLEDFVAWLAQVSPENHLEEFPRREDVIAYYVNGYNALAMYGVLQPGAEPKDKFTFFWRRRLMVGGRWISLYDLENDVIRPLGEPRVHFALNCMVRSCPRLPREPFVADRLEQQLETAARDFLNDPRHVHVDAGTVYLSRILDWYGNDFLMKSPSILDYVDRYRASPLPRDAKVAWLEYDWSLNRSH